MPKASGPEDKILYKHFNFWFQQLSFLSHLILKKSWNMKSEQNPFTWVSFLKLLIYLEKEFWKWGTALFILFLIAFSGNDWTLWNCYNKALNKTWSKFSLLWWALRLACNTCKHIHFQRYLHNQGQIWPFLPEVFPLYLYVNSL